MSNTHINLNYKIYMCQIANRRRNGEKVSSPTIILSQTFFFRDATCEKSRAHGRRRQKTNTSRLFFSSCVYNKMCIKWYIKTTNLPLPRPQQQRILFIQLNSKNIYFQNSFFSLVSFILLNCQRAGSVQCSLRAKILIVSEMLECHYPIWRLAKWQTDQSENFVTKIKIKKQEIAIILPFS